MLSPSLWLFEPSVWGSLVMVMRPDSHDGWNLLAFQRHPGRRRCACLSSGFPHLVTVQKRQWGTMGLARIWGKHIQISEGCGWGSEDRGKTQTLLDGSAASLLSQFEHRPAGFAQAEVPLILVPQLRMTALVLTCLTNTTPSQWGSLFRGRSDLCLGWLSLVLIKQGVHLAFIINVIIWGFVGLVFGFFAVSAAFHVVKAGNTKLIRVI